MSHTREALRRLDASLARLTRVSAFQIKAESARLVEKLQATDLDRKAPTEQALEALRRRLAAFYAGEDPHPPARWELRQAVWLLWNGSPQGAEIEGLMQAVASAAKGSARLALSLIEAWLRDFVAASRTVAAGGVAIKELLAAAGDPRLQAWRDGQHRFALFDAAEGPGRVARALLSGPQSVAEVLNAAGLDHPFRESGGYMRAVLRELLVKLPSGLRSAAAEATLVRALEVLAPGGTLRFGSELRGEIARSLLAAWLDGGPEPAPAMRDRVRDFLLRHLGDPRTREPDWMPVGEAATALMRRWLARLSLDAFFDLIAEHALDRQWRYRRAFWSACLKRGAIADAWIALGPALVSSARSMRDLAGSYGRLVGANVDRNHAVLLMRIGPLVLCEWSHNGKLRAWPAEWRNAPALHKAEYSRDDLTGLGLPFPSNPATGSGGSTDGSGLVHSGSERGIWQGSVAELLARRARFTITPAEWTP